MSDGSPIRIIVVDDQALFREGVRRFLEVEPDFLVVGDAADGEAAVEACGRLHPDVILLDVSMPRMTGLEALPQVRRAAPDTAVVLLTAAIGRRDAVEALMLGARGVILKTAETAQLARCIREVADGSFWVGHAAIGDLLGALRSADAPCEGAGRAPDPLTPRERQVVLEVARGSTNAEIGRAFGMRDQTVKNHLTRIFDKLGVSSRLELAMYAMEHRVGAQNPTARFA